MYTLFFCNQVKKLVQKVMSRDSFNYRKLTDQAIGGEEDKVVQEIKNIEVDYDKLLAGKGLRGVSFTLLASFRNSSVVSTAVLLMNAVFEKLNRCGVIHSICTFYWSIQFIFKYISMDKNYDSV